MNEEFDSVYDVDLAILDAVRQGGGGGGGGITSGQVKTMIDSALTPYSTTSQVEAMIQASGSTGGGDYVTVTSLTAVTSPTSGMVANVYDPASSANTTGEWWYDGSSWRPKKVWIERCSVAERVAIYNWLWKRDDEAQEYEDQYNVNHQCQVMWYSSDGYPLMLTSTGVYTWVGNNMSWGSVACTQNDPDADRLFYIDLESDGTLTKGYRKIAKPKETSWDKLEIAADGTVISGNGANLYNPIFDEYSYQFSHPTKAIKCEVSGQTYYGHFISCVRWENETDIFQVTGIITIAQDTYVGVWASNGQWEMYKKSFTKIA